MLVDYESIESVAAVCSTHDNILRSLSTGAISSWQCDQLSFEDLPELQSRLSCLLKNTSPEYNNGILPDCPGALMR